jgi:diguanylate cyclase (GGDEF)-like protein
VGIVSERDLVRLLDDRMRDRTSADLRVSDVMSSPVVPIRDTGGVDDAVRLMAERGFRRVPVVDAEGRLVGLVTHSDLLTSYSARVAAQRDDLERVVEERTRSLVEANRQLEALSVHDALLGIGNRRSMELALDQAHAVAQRYGHTYSVALYDVDHFKRYNDTYGHLAGDAALRQVADALNRTRRDSDTIHRYGGEEILVVLPDTGLAGARVAAERGRAAVERIELEHAGSSHGIVTVSAGVSCWSEAGEPCPAWSVLVNVADVALYRAKQSGRNRVDG